MSNYSDGLKAAYCYWPFVLIGLYTVVPTRYGNLYYDAYNLIWAIALSYFSSRENKKTTKENEIVFLNSDLYNLELIEETLSSRKLGEIFNPLLHREQT